MTSSTAPKTVLLKGSPLHSERAAKTGEAIKPGMLLEIHSDGTVKKHATAAGQAARRFAREADYVGGAIDDVYDDGENVCIYDCKPGDQIYAWLKAGQNVAKGVYLESAGNGSLRDVGTTGYVVAQALEAVNANGGVDARIKVEVQ
jgi:ABC-type branched-subunit amino acid transport system substrate-binding protein